MSQLLFNFGTSGNTNNWLAVTDRVMGGRSDTRFMQTETSIILQGVVSLENNGGFVSCRSRDQRFDFSAFEGIQLRYRSEGQNMAFTLHDNARFYLPKYRVNLPSTNMEWKEVRFTWSDFEQTVMGKSTGKTIPEELLNKIIRLSFITTDKKEGPFTLEVDYIEFVSED
jgi:hypothetical protein